MGTSNKPALVRRRATRQDASPDHAAAGQGGSLPLKTLWNRRWRCQTGKIGTTSRTTCSWR